MKWTIIALCFMSSIIMSQSQGFDWRNLNIGGDTEEMLKNLEERKCYYI